jgi:hypothetical protein
VCNIYSTEINHDENCNSPCYGNVDDSTIYFDLVIAQLVVCPNVASSIVNSAQYVATAMTTLFIVAKIALTRGVLIVASRSEWNDFIEKDSNL